uniref:Uncharacterized protein n=1 Tax=Oryza punctata TaxID=4537 RepID=A0A0E0JZT2_ORYPU
MSATAFNRAASNISCNSMPPRLGQPLGKPVQLWGSIRAVGCKPMGPPDVGRKWHKYHQGTKDHHQVEDVTAESNDVSKMLQEATETALDMVATNCSRKKSYQQFKEVTYTTKQSTFPSLVVLDVADQDGLKSLSMTQGAVPQLRLLQVENCIHEGMMIKGNYYNKFMENLNQNQSILKVASA